MDAIAAPTPARETLAPIGRAPAIRVLPLLGMYTAAASVGAVAGAGLGMFNAWGGGDTSLIARAAIMVGVLVLLTSFIVTGAFAAMKFGVVPTKANPSPTVQPAVLAAMSMARMSLSLVVALGMYLMMKPDGRTFWVCFLLAGLLSLLVETAWSLKVMRSLTTHTAHTDRTLSGNARGDR